MRIIRWGRRVSQTHNEMLGEEGALGREIVESYARLFLTGEVQEARSAVGILFRVVGGVAETSIYKLK